MRKKRVLVIGGGICTVLLTVALFFLFRCGAAYRSERQVLEKQYRQLAELNSRDPFPSVENRLQLEKNAAALVAGLNELEAALGRDPFPPDAREAADFSARVQRSIDRFRAKALEAGVTLPITLEAGFDSYASGGAIPSPAHVPRLSRQLYSMERVADVLIACGVGRIDGLSRDVFEALPEPVAAMPAGRRSRRAGSQPKSEAVKRDTRLIASYVEPNGLYQVERIEASFTAKEAAVWAVLARLAAVEQVMAVVDFSFQTQTDLMAYDPALSREVGVEALQRFAAEGILAGEAALARVDRIKAGNELLRVMLVVDVYNFARTTEEGVMDE